MKIAVNATILDDRPTGLGIYAVNVINELSSLIDIHVVTSHAAPFVLNRNITILKAPKIVQPGNKTKGAIARFWWLNSVLPGILKGHRIEFLINLTHHGPFLSSIPQLLTIHDLIPLRFEPHDGVLQHHYYRFLLPLLIRRAVAVSTPSEFTRREILATYGCDSKKIVVSGGGFNRHLAGTAASQRGKDCILMVGATYPHKNFDRVFEAYHDSQALRQHKLVIVGSRDKYADFLKAFAGELGIADNIVFIKYTDAWHLSELYHNALILVYPSLYEGFGMPPLEAMDAGTPVAASRIEPIQEVCGDAVLYFDPRSVTDMREKMELLLKNAPLRNNLALRGHEQSRKHTWRKVAQEIYNVVSRARP